MGGISIGEAQKTVMKFTNLFKYFFNVLRILAAFKYY